MSYITKTNLSIGPQFGSQMSQYAGMLSVAKRLGFDIKFFPEYLDVFRGVKIFDAFDLDLKLVENSERTLSKFTLKDVVCDERVFTLDSNQNWDIEGWFHLYHYWADCEDHVKNSFSFKQDIRDQAQANLDAIRQGEDYPVVSIHFRRGDYLQVASLNLSLDYYNEAISIFLSKFPYFKLLVFSDEIEWCKQVLIGDNVFFSENNSNYVDMCMMSMCNHNIIANSSFSWWGAYLNQNSDKIVICPEDYIGPSDLNSQFMNKNYYPKSWTSLKLT